MSANRSKKRSQAESPHLPLVEPGSPAPGTSGRTVVLGTGALGRAVAKRLLTTGRSVRMVNRSARMAEQPAGVELYGARLENPTRAAELLAGAETVFLCLGTAYHRFAEDWPPLLQSVLTAAEQQHLRVIASDSVYLYGDTDGRPMTEESPATAVTRKGVVRARLDRMLWEVHARGKARVAVVRGADFYGPWVRQSLLGERVFARLLAGQPMQVLGNPDLVHSYTYIDDMAGAMVRLAEDDLGLGKAWHAPTATAVTTRQLLERAARLTQQPARVAPMSRLMLRLGGLFAPEVRELLEMAYLVEKPFVVDSENFSRTFGIAPTPFDIGLAETVSWYRSAAKESS